MKTRNIIDTILIIIAAVVIGWYQVQLEAANTRLDVWKRSHEVIEYKNECLQDSLKEERLANAYILMTNNIRNYAEVN